MKKLFGISFKIPSKVYLYCEDDHREMLKLIEENKKDILDQCNEIFKNAFKASSTIEEVKHRKMIDERWKKRIPYSSNGEKRTCMEIAENISYAEDDDEQMRLNI